MTHLDALSNGRLVVHGYSGAGDQNAQINAQIYGMDGQRRRSFAMGRAVECLMADRRHHVWSAYFDEGVYIDPISAAGLVRWDSGGNHQCGYTPPKGVEPGESGSAVCKPRGVAVVHLPGGGPVGGPEVGAAVVAQESQGSGRR
ncbi:hypothetical protein [Streptomyces sp. NPDC003032]